MYAAVVIAGRPATGKSAALNTVITTLNSIQGADSSKVKLVKIYPGTYESLSDLYGCVISSEGDWMDGIFTSIFRKAHKVSRTRTILGTHEYSCNNRIYVVIID